MTTLPTILPTILNVHADAEVGLYILENPSPRPQVPRLPCNPVELQIQGKTITSRYRKNIRYAAAVRQLQTVHSITEDNYQLVDESVLARAINRNPTLKTWITKFTSQLLPTESLKHCYDNEVDPECLHCNQFSNTFIHQLQCESEIILPDDYLYSVHERSNTSTGNLYHHRPKQSSRQYQYQNQTHLPGGKHFPPEIPNFQGSRPLAMIPWSITSLIAQDAYFYTNYSNFKKIDISSI
jgi:hypothetical protein